MQSGIRFSMNRRPSIYQRPNSSMIQENVQLALYSNFQIGGRARFFIEAFTQDDVRDAVAFAQKQQLPIFVLGLGTNLLIDDKGYDGVVIKASFAELSLVGSVLRVGAGVAMKDLLEFAVTHQLKGLEWAGGLPGTVGGAVFGNAGCFGGEMKDSVSKVVSLALTDTSAQLIERTNQQCEFSYRDSIFKRNVASGASEVILEVVFELQLGDGALLRAAVDEKIAYRQQRQPLEYPNVGSIFKNIDVRTVPAETLKQFEAKIKTDPFPVLPTAVLISAAGLKGFRVGGAMVSEKHANFIVNVGGATASDVKAVMAQVKLELKKQFGVEVEQEVIFV